MTDYTAQVKEQIRLSEENLLQARKMINQLKAAYEPTEQLEKDYQAAFQRLERFKAAFK